MDSDENLDTSWNKISGFSNEDTFRFTKKHFGRVYDQFAEKVAHPFEYFHEKEVFGKPRNEIKKNFHQI